MISNKLLLSLVLLGLFYGCSKIKSFEESTPDEKKILLVRQSEIFEAVICNQLTEEIENIRNNPGYFDGYPKDALATYERKVSLSRYLFGAHVAVTPVERSLPNDMRDVRSLPAPAIESLNCKENVASFKAVHK